MRHRGGPVPNECNRIDMVLEETGGSGQAQARPVAREATSITRRNPMAMVPDSYSRPEGSRADRAGNPQDA
jgi:hypothetical protein